MILAGWLCALAACDCGRNHLGPAPCLTDGNCAPGEICRNGQCAAPPAETVELGKDAGRPALPDAGCPPDADCQPGETEQRRCGACGSQGRVCGSDCKWEPWNDCEDAGICNPGDLRACGGCGLQQCDEACGWGGCGPSVCAGGQVCLDGGCCTPHCGQCGGSDGCGGTCLSGACPPGNECDAGSCVCDGNSCDGGCCVGNTCSIGTAVSACGQGGAACASCGSGQVCFDQACCTPTCTTCGPNVSDGCGGTCPCSCNPSTCPNGCCVQNSCLAGTSGASCGTGGNQCQSCGAGQVCSNQACCTPSCAGKNCGDSDGCGGICQGGPCPSGQTCVGGSCQCNGASCPGGCCAGNQCQSGGSVGACGGGGAACASCGPGQVCYQQACCTPNCTGALCGAPDGCGGVCASGACAAGQTCVGGTCECDAASCGAGCCAGNACEAGGATSACGSGGNACQSCGPGQVCYDQACCTPSCSDSNCGGSDGCGGTCAPCCYACDTNASAHTCSLSTVISSGGSCPSGYSLNQPACAPCWSCMNYGIAYCTSTSCCGPWQSTGVVGGGCTCYSCDGQSGVSAASENEACYQSQQNTLALQQNRGGWCGWPSSPYTASCGYDANTSSGTAYIGSPPVQLGGCTSCSFTCGGACCLPKGNGLVSVADASQCCSGKVGPCWGGTGNDCCQ